MKKRLLLGLAALAAVTLTSCQKDQVINETPQQNAIEFGTYIGRDAQTKGSVLTTDGLKTQGFGVYAYYTDNANYNATSSPLNFMNNEEVKYGTNSWEYSPVKYWPNESQDKLTFFAYAPYQSNRNASSTQVGDPILTIDVDTDVTKHIDYTYATAGASLTTLTNITKQSINSTIPFVFKHAMSRVGFKVEAVIDQTTGQGNGDNDEDNQTNSFNMSETTITVQEVELYAVNNFYTNSQLNLNGGSWIYGDRNTESYKLRKDGNNFNDIWCNVTVDKTQLNKDDSYIFMIPSAFNVKVRVKYTVTTKDSSLLNEESKIVNDITSDNFNFTFVQGKAYNFVLHLGLTSVKLSADVAEWDEATDHVVNVPLNF